MRRARDGGAADFDRAGYVAAQRSALDSGMPLRMESAADELMREIDVLLLRVKRQAPNAADHLERSCEAVVFNMGEGVGAYRPKVKIAAYEIAKREASEVRAILRRLVIKRSVTAREIQRADNLANALVGMLTAAIKAIGDRE